MTDHNAWLGHWPFRDLGDRGNATFLLKAMDRLGIERTWVSPLDAILQRSPRAANASLAAIVEHDADRLTCVPLFHPGLADGGEVIRELGGRSSGTSVVRLLPPLHAINERYTERNLEALVASGVTILLTRRLVDPRARHPMLPIPELTNEDVLWWLRRLAGATVILAGCVIGEVEALKDDILGSNTLVESSFLDAEESLDVARKMLGSHRVVPGSNAPMNFQEALSVKWHPRPLPPYDISL